MNSAQAPFVEDFVAVVELTTRAVHSHLVSHSGQVTYSSTRSIEPCWVISDQPYVVNFDPTILWGLVCTCVADCVKRAGNSRIATISTSSQRFTTAIVDKHGKTAALCPNIDARGAEVEDVFEPAMGDEAHKITGLHPSFLFTASRLGWFKESHPRLFQNMKYILTVDGWLYYRLTGVPAEEPSQAAGTFLFDIRKRKWCDEICEIAGVQTDQLPKVVNYSDFVGYPTEEAQSLAGISGQTPVIMGAGDTQCSGIGSSAISPGQAYVSLGSTAPLQMVMPEPITDAAKRMWTGCFPIDGKWVLESNSGMCGAVFDWLALSVLQVVNGKDINYERFDEMARVAPTGSADVCTFLGPSIMDARAFTNILPAAIVLPSLIIGKKPGAAEIARACYEEIAYACRGNVEQMHWLWPKMDPAFRVAGGLAKSEVLPQILADVLARTVMVPIERRASAVGSAIAGISFTQSEKPKYVVNKLVKTKSTLPSKDAEVYESSYRRWRNIREKLGDLV